MLFLLNLFFNDLNIDSDQLESALFNDATILL